MGSKLNEMKNRSNEGNRSLESAREVGQKAVEDATSMSEIVNSLPADIDDEIVQAAETVKEGTRSDAENFMDSTVNEQLDAGKNVMSSANEMGHTQIENNNDVISKFQQMDSIGDFGKSARSEGVNAAQQSISAFEGAIAENESSVQEAESNFQNQRSTITGLF